jgi:hypothetical protein
MYEDVEPGDRQASARSWCATAVHLE